MAAPKLTPEQRETILGWLAAGYSDGWILARLRTRPPAPDDDGGGDGGGVVADWPPISRQALGHYRARYGPRIAELRQARHQAALASGLALKEERVRRLAEHADQLDLIKWVPDEKGRMWNEKAWRETLDDIAREMGQRRQGVDLTLAQELEAFLDRLRDNLDPETYARVIALAAGAAADRG